MSAENHPNQKKQVMILFECTRQFHRPFRKMINRHARGPNRIITKSGISAKITDASNYLSHHQHFQAHRSAPTIIPAIYRAAQTPPTKSISTSWYASLWRIVKRFAAGGRARIAQPFVSSSSVRRKIGSMARSFSLPASSFTSINAASFKTRSFRFGRISSVTVNGSRSS